MELMALLKTDAAKIIFSLVICLGPIVTAGIYFGKKLIKAAKEFDTP